MGGSHSQDLRDRVLGARDRGIKTSQVADLFSVSASWVRRVVQRRREQGQTTPRPRGGVRVVKIDMQRLGQLVREQPDATIRQLHQRLGTACCESAVGMALGRLGLSFKKTIHASEQDRPDVAARRDAWERDALVGDAIGAGPSDRFGRGQLLPPLRLHATNGIGML